MSSKTCAIAKKEFLITLSSLSSVVFNGAFLIAVMFTFFWVDTFFARKVADLRPLFHWFPVLLMFITAVLTMRMWSEEERLGTVETFLTSPVKPFELVLGKFLACLGLTTLVILFTIPLPITVALLGDLDWGPVIGGYLASILLAGAYCAIGLYVSSRTDNQMVSLIVTILICSVFYAVGSDVLTPLVGTSTSEILKLLGTGSRFQSISRGVLDLRDLYYYVTLIGVFLALNTLGLEQHRWTEKSKGSHRFNLKAITVLVIANLVIANFWLQPLRVVRFDLTNMFDAKKPPIYTLSDVTKQYLRELKEPLLIRGYFSSKTHPLLAPLVPILRDLLYEYQVYGGGKVRVEIVDPRENPEIEEEAKTKYGIEPVPFQVSGKYEVSLVNSFFNVVVQYGDKFEVLGFRDLIEVKALSETNIEVGLKNPEYDITKAIRKVLYGFKGIESFFKELNKPIKLTIYSSQDSLPAKLKEYQEEVVAVLKEYKKLGGKNFSFDIVDPTKDAKIARKIQTEYGIKPRVPLLGRPFYFSLLLRSGNEWFVLPDPKELTKEQAKKVLEAGLTRFLPGFLKVVGLAVWENKLNSPWLQQYGLGKGSRQFELLKDYLRGSFKIKIVDLKKGIVPSDVDILVVVSPERMSEKELFAMDQFLMKGGNVVLVTSPFSIVRTDNFWTARKNDSGLEDWLKFHKIKIKKEMVLDKNNVPF
ncbi:MAG: ABC transporter permease, partial [Candidatus Dadabacteria bacterium]